MSFARKQEICCGCSCTIRPNMVEGGQMMNNLMFHPFVTGSISVIFARDTSVLQMQMRGMRLLGEDEPVFHAIPACSKRLKIFSPETLYNIIIFVMCIELPVHFLTARHLSFVADDAGYLLYPFGSPYHFFRGKY